jgi:hypothetical protein
VSQILNANIGIGKIPGGTGKIHFENISELNCPGYPAPVLDRSNIIFWKSKTRGSRAPGGRSQICTHIHRSVKGKNDRENDGITQKYSSTGINWDLYERALHFLRLVQWFSSHYH